MLAPMYDALGNFGGCSVFSKNVDGKPEMVGFEPASLSPLENLRSVLRSFFGDREIAPAGGGKGVRVSPRSGRWSLLTAYICPDAGGFVFFEAVPDLDRGIDIDDEKWVCEGSLAVIEAGIRDLIRCRG